MASAYTVTDPFAAHAIIQSEDAGVVAAFQATYPNGREGLSPVAAAGIYGAGGPTGPFTGLPWIFVDTIPFGLDVNAASGTFLDVVGDTAHYIWIIFMTLSGPTISLPPDAEAIRQRRWIRGFELPEGGEGGSTGSALGNMVCRDSSRTPEGMGLSWRGDKTNVTTMTLTEFTGGGVSAFRASWERIYFVLRGAPSNVTTFWRCRNTANNNSGAALRCTPGGGIEIYNINTANTFTLIATSSVNFTAGKDRLDVVVQFSSGTGGRIRLWVNRVLAADASVAPIDEGIGQTGFHASSEVGNTTAANGIELDIDDWINAEIPILFNSLDWLTGSHVVLSKVTGFDPSSDPLWVGDWRILLQNPAFKPTSAPTINLDSSSSGVRLAASTDADALALRGWQQSGIAAFLVSMYSINAGATDGQLGYTLLGGADVLSTVNEAGSFAWTGKIYRPSGMITPDDILPIVLLHTKSADANQNRVRMLLMAVEYLGAFSPCDQADTTVDPITDAGKHNAPYVSPVGTWGLAGAPPFGQITVQGGIYVGDGVGQDIPLDAPAHWIWVRPLTGASGGGHWWSTMIGPHRRIDLRDLRPDLLPQFFIDDAGACFFRLAGDDTQANALGVSYQWVAYSDPGMRFLLNGAFFHDASLVSAVNPLVDTSFLAEGAHIFQEAIGESGLGVSGYWFKGVGHAPSRASLLDSAENLTVMQFATGSVVSQTALHPGDRSAAFALWRTTEPCRTIPDRAVALTTYIGNGAAGTRDIPVNLNGHFPIFALVTPHNAGSHVRDPSHTGLTSSSATLDGTSTTAITGGGADKITVGTTLNVDGIVYDVFVLPGGTTGSGGWATNGTYYPVPPAEPCGTQWPPVPVPPPPPPTPGSACPDDFPVDLS